MPLRLVVFIFIVALAGTAAAQPKPPAPPAAPKAAAPTAAAPPRVFADAGDIYIERAGVKTRLTSSEEDSDPVLAPDGSYVVYTRNGHGRGLPGYDLGQFCTAAPRPDELRRVNSDGGGDRLLFEGRKGNGQAQLCDFRSKQFSADGSRLYFLTPGWTTSGALHVYDTRAREQRFVQPANDLLVLNFCQGQYRDALAIQQHRYFVFGGSYDWYWLYDATGKKELGPLGEFDGPDAVIKAAHETWCQ
jgi:WD40-like Beta Propeller Repeat